MKTFTEWLETTQKRDVVTLESEESVIAFKVSKTSHNSRNEANPVIAIQENMTRSLETLTFTSFIVGAAVALYTHTYRHTHKHTTVYTSLAHAHPRHN